MATRKKTNKQKIEIVNDEYKVVDNNEETNYEGDTTPELNTKEGEDSAPETILKSEYDALYEKYLYKCAEFENYIKRTNKHISEMKEFQDAHLLETIVPSLNTIYAAVKMSEDNGVNLIYKSLKDALAGADIEIIVPEVGDIFTMETMHAIASVPAPDTSADNTVVDVMSPGYSIKGTILIYPKVVVYKA